MVVGEKGSSPAAPVTRLAFYHFTGVSMKRINPKTGVYFRHGDIRDDGYRFIYYDAKRIKKDGYFIEHWKNPTQWIKYISREKLENISLEGLAGKILKNAKARAKKKNGKVTITKDWILDKLKIGKSELTNLPFDLNRKTKNFYAPSLDRINSSNRDYEENNCRLILWGENQALNSANDQEILPILEAMVEAIKKNVKQKQSSRISNAPNTPGRETAARWPVFGAGPG